MRIRRNGVSIFGIERRKEKKARKRIRMFGDDTSKRKEM
jgi:hypothetical protein